MGIYMNSPASQSVRVLGILSAVKSLVMIKLYILSDFFLLDTLKWATKRKSKQDMEFPGVLEK